MKEQRVKCLVHFQKHVKKLYRKYSRKFTYILPVHIQNVGLKKGSDQLLVYRGTVYIVSETAALNPFEAYIVRLVQIFRD